MEMEKTKKRLLDCYTPIKDSMVLLAYFKNLKSTNTISRFDSNDHCLGNPASSMFKSNKQSKYIYSWSSSIMMDENLQFCVKVLSQAVISSYFATKRGNSCSDLLKHVQTCTENLYNCIQLESQYLVCPPLFFIRLNPITQALTYFLNLIFRTPFGFSKDASWLSFFHWDHFWGGFSEQ